LALRPENIYALSLAGLQQGMPELLCMDDLSWTGVFPSNTFALVDHNRLLPQYETDNPEAQVVAIVDHHDDEGFYATSAEPRIIAPSGSCASHVAGLSPPGIPAGLASLLLSAILIDTQGLKAGGKALQVDREAAAFLLTKISSSSPLSSTDLSQPSRRPITLTNSSADVDFMQNQTTELLERKFSVSHFTTRDLLRRDYKQYHLYLTWLDSRPAINAGLSTVPINLKLWMSRDPEGFWSGTKQWMSERELCVLGILTSFRDKKVGTGVQGKHKRQMLWVVREGAEICKTFESTEDRSCMSTGELSKVDIDQLASRLWDGLESSEILQLKKSHFEKFGTRQKDVDTSMRVRIYKQENTDATRKTAAPVMRAILEERADPEGETE
jgi:exopolyphosphatase